MGRICITYLRAGATSCVCFILLKPITLLNNAGYEPKQITWMPPPLRAFCSVERPGLDMSRAKRWRQARELVRLHTQLSDDVARYKNEIHALLVVLFPEFTQVFADPSRPTALALLKLYPNPQAVVTAGEDTLTHKLHELSPRHYGRATAQQLVSLAKRGRSAVGWPLQPVPRACGSCVINWNIP